MNNFFKRNFSNWFSNYENLCRINKLNHNQKKVLIELLRDEIRSQVRFKNVPEHAPQMHLFDFYLNEIAGELLHLAQGNKFYFSASTLSAEANSIFKNRFSLPKLTEDIQKLKQDGYIKAPFILSKKQISEIIEALSPFHFKTKWMPFMEMRGSELINLIEEKNFPNIDKGDTFWLEDQNNFARTLPIFEIATDPFIVSYVGEYFGCMPILVQANSWFSFPSKLEKKNLSENAHFFHQDKEFIKFLKVFIYLNDVGEENGPHCYIEGSHLDTMKLHGIPFSERVMDEDIEKYYSKVRIKNILAPAGTVIFADTSCAHKGQPIKNGARIILQLEYASSLHLSYLEIDHLKVSQ